MNADYLRRPTHWNWIRSEAEIRAAAQSADIQAVRESDETMWGRLRTGKPHRFLEGSE